MRSRSGILGWVVAGLAGFALGVAGFNTLSRDGASEDASGPPPAQELQPEPSEFAAEAIPRSLLRLYRETAESLGLDWSVIAAIDQIDGAFGPAERRERISAIGYSLAAHGAPDDYRLAAEGHGGSPGYARQVLQLADRYRELGNGRVPPASGPLQLPARGPVVASFGNRLGLLHDGIDIAGSTGDPVRAAADGLVASTGTHSLFGQYTCVLHRFAPPLNGERRLTTCYGNQSRIATEPGATVERGDVIGRVGCTGACLRPGLHFQARLGAGPSASVTDPAPYLEDPEAIRDGVPLEARSGDGSG